MSQAGAPPVPRTWSIRRGDVIAAFLFNAVLIVGMWIRHGGLGLLGSAGSNLTAIGELTALLGTYAALIQIVLMSRIPWLERSFGMDAIAHWHRWLGFATVSTICAHVVFTTWGYALGDGKSIAAETWTFFTQYRYVFMAAVSTVMLVVIAVVSIRAARRRLSYESWHFIHLYTYLAIALGFAHEMAVGTDLTTDPVAQVYWVALYVVVAALVLGFRFGAPLRATLKHHLVIDKIIPEGAGVVSIYMTGRNLHELHSRPGQYFNWRFLTRDGWWRAHPFSLSARPNGQFLRITVKAIGGGTQYIHRLSEGTRVGIEGPYGVFTAINRNSPHVLLIAGGIGITPLRALLEEFPAGKGVTTLIYRASSWDDVILKDELDHIAKVRQCRLIYLVGKRGSEDVPQDPFSSANLQRLVPDIHRRDVFICGPPAMMEGVSDSLRSLGVNREDIHYERFALL